MSLFRLTVPSGPQAEPPVRGRAVLGRDHVLTGDAIDGVEVAVPRRGGDQLAGLAVDHRVDQDRRLRRVPVVHVVRGGLEVPRHLAGVDVDRDQRAREQVVPLAASLREGRRRIAGAEDVQLGLRIVDAGQPRLRPAVTGGVEAGPGVEAGIAFLHRDRIELPLQLAGFGIERLQEAGRVEVVAGPGDDVVAGDDRRHRREVLLVERGDFLVPALLAGFRFEGDEVVVRRLHVEVVLPHPEAAIRDVGAASRFPEVVPELAAVAGVERPGVVRSGHVERVVDEQRRAFDRSVGRNRKVSLAFAADDHAAAAAAAEAPPGPSISLTVHARVSDFTVV